jgi:hypothetical protein
MRVLMLVLLLVGSAAAEPRKPDVPARLHAYYGTVAGYQKVHRDVMAWHKTTRNGCVAFASTALRHIGIAIPFDVRKDGFSVSRITGAFSRYLSEDLGWERIGSADQLRPGDVVFTVDAPCCPGYPAHVMVFGPLDRPVCRQPGISCEPRDGRQFQPRRGWLRIRVAAAPIATVRALECGVGS